MFSLFCKSFFYKNVRLEKFSQMYYSLRGLTIMTIILSKVQVIRVNLSIGKVKLVQVNQSLVSWE